MTVIFAPILNQNHDDVYKYDDDDHYQSNISLAVSIDILYRDDIFRLYNDYVIRIENYNCTKEDNTDENIHIK